MERRELLTLLGAGAAGLAVGGSARAEDGDKHEKHDEAKWKEHHEHVKVIGECALICNVTSAHCLRELAKEECKDREQVAKTARAADDCGGFCAQTIILMTRHSPMSAYAHAACADACRDCAAECDKSSHELIKKCAEHCRECERVCREHVAHAH